MILQTVGSAFGMLVAATLGFYAWHAIGEILTQRQTGMSAMLATYAEALVCSGGLFLLIGLVLVVAMRHGFLMR